MEELESGLNKHDLVKFILKILQNVVMHRYLGLANCSIYLVKCVLLGIK